MYNLFFLENNNNTNPDTNLYLQQAIEVAKKNSMPLTTIQNCIKQSQVSYMSNYTTKISFTGNVKKVVISDCCM